MNAERWAERFDWHLQSIPELISLARLRGDAGLQAQRLTERVSGGGDVARLPFEAGGMDDADYLWAMLVLYGREVTDVIGGSSPAVLRDSAVTWSLGEAQGFRAAVETRQAVIWAREVTDWLCRHADVIGSEEQLGDAEEVLFERVRTMRLVYGMDDRPTYDRRRRCARCGERGVIATWAQVGGREICHVLCTICGSTFDEGGGDDADLLAGSEASQAQRRHDQAVAT